MKKGNIFNIISLSFLVLITISCDDYLNEFERLDGSNNIKPIATLSTTTATVTEGNDVSFTLTLDKALNETVDYKLEYVIGSTASFRDYTTSGVELTLDEGGYGQGSIGHTISVPAFQKSVTFTISPIIDLDVEGIETLKILLRSSGNGLGLVGANSSNIEIKINDYVSNDLGIELSWAQIYADSFGTLHDGSYIDLTGSEAYFIDWDYDLYVENSAGSEVDGYMAATGNHPEISEILSSMPDDDYYVYVDLWSAGAVPQSKFNHDLNIKIGKYGVWSTVVNIPTTSDDTFSDYVLGITKSGNIYTVFDPYDPTIVYGSGRINKRVFRNKLKVK